MKLLFKISGLLKLLFIISSFFAFEYQANVHKNQLKLLDYFNFGKPIDDLLKLFRHFDISVPWYVYLLLYMTFTLYVVSIIGIYLFSFKPQWRFSVYLHKQNPSTLLYVNEVFLFVLALILMQFTFNNLYAQSYLSMIESFFDPISAQKLQFVKKIEAFNSTLFLISSVLALGLFWHIRKLNLSE